MNTEANEVVKAVVKAVVREIPSVAITVNDAWNGRRVNTDKRFPDKSVKFSLSIPVPESDADAQKLYGVPLVKIIEAGVIQGFYSATGIDNVIKEAHENGLTASDTTVIEMVKEAAEEHKFVARERTSVSKEVKTLKSNITASGMSIVEAIEAMKKLKELRDKGIDINTL